MENDITDQEKCEAVVKNVERQEFNITGNGGLYCNTAWDSVSCWPRTLAGTYAVIPCPDDLKFVDHTKNATRFCQENGLWVNRSVYNACLTGEIAGPDTKHSNVQRIIYTTGFSISTVALVIAVGIFMYFRSLRCLRNTIHTNLMLSFLLRNICYVVFSNALFALGKDALCKTICAVFNYAHCTNFFWMFVEGIYLHTVIVWAYSADKIRFWLYAFIGWGVPVVVVAVWCVVRAYLDDTNCWMPSEDSLYDYVFNGPILVVLFANVLFLSTIIWVLVTKLKASHSMETKQLIKAFRSTVILLPLLGITYIMLLTAPKDRLTQQIFDYINGVSQSLQGLFVAVFYCFLNGEVRGVLKKKFLNFRDSRTIGSRYTKASVVQREESISLQQQVKLEKTKPDKLFVSPGCNGSCSRTNRFSEGYESGFEEAENIL